MKIREVSFRGKDEIDRLYALWEKSVRATHDFLSEEDIVKISEYVPRALNGVSRLIVMEDENSLPLGFMGIEDGRIEMLFVSPENTGRGIGGALIRYAIEKHAVSEVCVNEDNARARGFYEHIGFSVYKRTDVDEQGGPFPILYMRLNSED